MAAKTSCAVTPLGAISTATCLPRDWIPLGPPLAFRLGFGGLGDLARGQVRSDQFLPAGSTGSGFLRSKKFDVNLRTDFALGQRQLYLEHGRRRSVLDSVKDRGRPLRGQLLIRPVFSAKTSVLFLTTYPLLSEVALLGRWGSATERR